MRHSKFLSILDGAAAALTYLFRDLFTTDRAAGAINGTAAEPGSGNRAVTDPNNIFSIANGRLTISGTVVSTNAGYVISGFDRFIGRAFHVRFASRATPNTLKLGWEVNTSLGVVTITSGGDLTTAGMTIRYGAGSIAIATTPTFSVGTTVEMMMVQRSNGSFLLIRDSSSAANTWYLNWIYHGQSNDVQNCIAKIQPSAAGAISTEVEDIEIVDLAGAWLQDYGIATDRKASAAINDTITMVADGTVEFGWTPTSSAVLDLMVRRTDDNNCIIVRADQAAGNIKVFEKNAGVETQKGSTGTQTWTVGTPYRIIARCVGTSIVVLVDVTFKITGTTAFNQTATGVKTTLAGVDLVAWPHQIAASLVQPGAQRPAAWTGLEYLSEIVRLQSVLASGSHNIVYLGGSVTNGTAASNLETTSNRALIGAWLNARFPSATLTHYNAGVGGTPSWYGLVRLATDVVARSPDLIIVDFAVNDATNAWDQPSAEALVRRLRTALPSATILCEFNTYATNPGTNDPTNGRAITKSWWRTVSNTYHIPYWDFDVWMVAAVAAGASITTYLADNVHPTDAGHAIIAAGLESVLAQPTATDSLVDWTTALASIPRLNANTANYESTPVIINGVDGTTAGTWTTVATTAISSTDGATPATVAFTGTFQTFCLDANYGVGSGVVAWKVDAGSYTNFDLTALSAPYFTPYTSFTRGAHTITLKVISGTVQINRFLAI